jgi:hypothetical protein
MAKSTTMPMKKERPTFGGKGREKEGGEEERRRAREGVNEVEVRQGNFFFPCLPLPLPPPSPPFLL